MTNDTASPPASRRPSRRAALGTAGALGGLTAVLSFPLLGEEG